MQAFKLINPDTGAVVRMTVDESDSATASKAPRYRKAAGAGLAWRTARYSYTEGRAIIRDYAPLILRLNAEKALGESLKWVVV